MIINYAGFCFVCAGASKKGNVVKNGAFLIGK